MWQRMWNGYKITLERTLLIELNLNGSHTDWIEVKITVNTRDSHLKQVHYVDFRSDVLLYKTEPDP